MKKHNGLYKDIVGWDVENWGKFVDFIYELGFSINGKKVLDIGARDGGMSLLFALDGAEVVCSDLDGPTDDAAKLHQKYEVSDKITYAKIDATKIPKEYDGAFDIVVFKSVMGGVGSYENEENERACAESIYRCLKPGGFLVFAENLTATQMHMFLRKRFKGYGERWHYETDEHLRELFHKFKLVKAQYVGFVGCFGKGEMMRKALGKVDTMVFDRVVPKKHRYIAMYCYKK